ncbi:MAG: diguanylate cyclase [bacterium]|nr:diguanylate cyclase [bacterium]
MKQAEDTAAVLIVDDSEAIRKQIKKTLRSQDGLFGTIYEAEDGIQGFKKLLDVKIDIILCDVVMPQIDGFKLLAMVKNHPELKHIPIIMLTAEGNQDKKNMGFKRGASDYLTKPFDDAELLARVRVHLELKLLQDKLRATNRELTKLSNTDALTQVFNRRYLMQVMTKEVLRAKRYGTALSLLLIDIDNFKGLNDTYGHQAGDQILIDLCQRMKEKLRFTDILARYGGEEFAILLTQIPLVNAEKAGEHARRRVARTPFMIGDQEIPVTVSCGASSFVPEICDTVDTLIMEADKALYEAKKQGKNRVVTSKVCLAYAADSEGGAQS